MDNPDPFSNKTEEQFDPSWAELVSLPSTWMIDVDDTPIGHLGWVPHAERIGEFYIVIGDTSYWRQGFGKKAMRWMLTTAKRRRMRALYGRVLGHNTKALQFFQRCGFDPVAKSENYFERNGETHDLHWIAHRLGHATT